MIIYVDKINNKYTQRDKKKKRNLKQKEKEQNIKE